MEENTKAEILSNCYLEIDCDAIERNLRTLREKTRSRVMAVVKNNGYGLGLIPYARLLAQLGVTELAVGSYDEAMRLRREGVDLPLLLLTPQIHPGAVADLIRSDVTLTVGSAPQCRAAACAAEETGIRPSVHIKLDTGLGRFGFGVHELRDIKAATAAMEVWGVYTHFANPYGGFKTTRRQFDLFTRLVKELSWSGVHTGVLHCCASGALLRYTVMHLNMVRPGSALLGRVPGADGYGLTPALTLKAPILDIRTGGNRSIGYHGAVRLPGKTRAGILSVGDACGLSNGNGAAQYTRVGGQRVRILGRLGIGCLAVDLSGIRCQEGDLAQMDINPLFCAADIPRIYTDRKGTPYAQAGDGTGRDAAGREADMPAQTAARLI